MLRRVWKRMSLAVMLLGTALVCAPEPAAAQDSKKPLDVVLEGQIVEGDGKDTVRNNPCKIHVIKLEQGKTYIVDLLSGDFDPYVRIETSDGVEVAKDDDSGGNLQSRVRLVAAKDDAYKFIATSFAGGGGNYTLKVKDANQPIAKAGAKLDTPTEKKETEVAGQLQDGDPVHPARNQPGKTYSIELAENVPYVITMDSADFDSYLVVLDANGKILDQDDDSGGNLNSRIVFVPATKAVYTICATTFDGGLGGFQIKVRPATEYGQQAKADPKAVHDGSKSFFIAGNLTEKDEKDAVQQNSPCHIHQVKLQSGKTYTIDLMSGRMDCFLRVEDAGKKELAEDDDGGERLNSRLSFTPEADGVYRIIATNLDGNPGPYVLTVREQK